MVHPQARQARGLAVCMFRRRVPCGTPTQPLATGDMWSLGVVLFVMLSGSHVPFGNRGLGQTSIPNMPGRGESVDALQSWLQVEGS